MDRERMERIATLFAAAIELCPSDKRAFLDRECDGDQALRSEVSDLLGQDDRANQEDFLGARTWKGPQTEPSVQPSGVPDRYENLREHKRGGMGVVYKAWDVRLRREVAYKVINAECSEAEEFRRKFAREAKITAQLQYPGIVPVFGLEEDGSGRPSYAMQFVEGINFGELIRGHERAGVGQRRKRLEAFLAACRIVAFAHDKDFVHGDLSPRNLMIAEGGAAFVVDWGLARYLGSARSSENIEEPGSGSAEPATQGFVAPSVRNGGPRTRVTDVYSLGAVLAALVLGLTPGGQPVLDGPGWRDVPRPLRAIIRAAMADREDGFYPDAGALADDLASLLDGDKVRVDREPWREWAWRSIHRHPARATVVVSSLVLLSIVSTSVALVSAAQDRAARKDEEVLRRTEEAKLAHREALWSEANEAMLRCSTILYKNPAPEMIDLKTINNLLQIMASLGKNPEMPLDTNEFLKAELEAAQQVRDRSEAQEREAAEPELRNVISILERLESEVPDARNVRFYLAKSYYGLGSLELIRTANQLGLPAYFWISYQNFAGKPPSQPEVEEALSKIDKAMELIPLCSPPPSEPDSLRQLELALWKIRGWTLIRLGRFTESLISFDRALPLAEGSAEVAIRKLRPIFIKAAEVEQSHMPWSEPPGLDHARAIRMAEYLLDQPSLSPEAVFNAACAFSLASLDPASNGPEKERRAKRGIALLVQIEEKGYFRDARRAKELHEDATLNPLRSRNDFQVLASKIPNSP